MNGHRVVFPGVVVSYDVTVGYSNTVVELIQASLSLVVFGTDVPCLHPGCALTSRTEALSILYGTSGYVMGFSAISPLTAIPRVRQQPWGDHMLAASPTVHVQSTSEALKSALQIYFYVGTASELIADFVITASMTVFFARRRSGFGRYVSHD